MSTNEELLKFAEEFGTPLMVVDHKIIRDNYEKFVNLMPRVKPFYAIKANPEPEIIRTLYKCGSNFDVASLEELNLVESSILGSIEEKEIFLEYNVIYANPVKRFNSLHKIEMKQMAMTYDNFAELDKIAKYCRSAKLILRIDVPNDGSIVELSSKFGAPYDECMDLIHYAIKLGFEVKGISFHVGSQCTNTYNYVRALELANKLFNEAETHGIHLKLVDIGGGFPAPYDKTVPAIDQIAYVINNALDEYFPDSSYEIIAEPGRYLVANAATSIVQVNGKSIRKGRPFYYINDGVYHTFSGVIFDHIQYHFKAFKPGPGVPSAVAGPTCDALDKVVMDDPLPNLEIGDLLYSENTGAYTNASATHFNGFDPATIIHINT
jgi:ornithine decarboxylase